VSQVIIYEHAAERNPIKRLTCAKNQSGIGIT